MQSNASPYSSTFAKIALACFVGVITHLDGVSQTWVQKGDSLNAPGKYSHFGNDVDISADGNVIVVGSPENDGDESSVGFISVFEWVENKWKQVGEDIRGVSTYEHFGGSVSMSWDGNIIAAGGSGFNWRVGIVRVFNRKDNLWSQIGSDITGESSQDRAAYNSLDSAGITLAVGSPGFDNTYENAGKVRVFEWTGGSWSQKGTSIEGLEAEDNFGASVKLSASGNILAIGAGIYHLQVKPERVRIFTWNGTDWVQKGLEIQGPLLVNNVALSIDMSSDGNVVAIGGPQSDENGTNTGHVCVYDWVDGEWVIRGQPLLGRTYSSRAGNRVSLSYDGLIVAVGAPTLAGPEGYVMVYEWKDSSWVQLGVDISAGQRGDLFGSGVSLSKDGKTIVVGAEFARLADGLGYGGGGVRVFTLNCITVYATDTAIACETYTWMDGKTYYTSSVSETFTKTNDYGCDTVFTLNLHMVDSAGTDTITACDSYTWVDGNTYSINNNTASFRESYIIDCPENEVKLDLTILKSTFRTDSVEECPEYKWIDGNTYSETTSEVKFVLTNSVGCDSIISLHYTALDPNTYRCDSSLCAISFPNVFTPNGDGINDRFQLIDPCLLETQPRQLEIYNRWGKLVWIALDGLTGWDGNIDESGASEGIYYYFYKGTNDILKGSFSLINEN
jgi:gliding motility-associated-like protein